MDSIIEAMYPAIMPIAPARVMEFSSGNPHLKGMSGRMENHGELAIRPSLPARLAGLSAAIHPNRVPSSEAIQPVAMARMTGNSRNTRDLRENTWEYRIRATRVIREMTQLPAIQGAPMPYRFKPIMAMTGPMTIGPMSFFTVPMAPV